MVEVVPNLWSKQAIVSRVASHLKKTTNKVKNIRNFENTSEKQLPIHIFMSLNFIGVKRVKSLSKTGALSCLQ